VALNATGDRLFVVKNGTNELAIVDTASNTVVGTVGVGNGATEVAFQ
jgi:YVTN family beta-propeller protein